MQLLPNQTKLYDVTITTKSGNVYHVTTYTELMEAEDCKRDLTASYVRCGMSNAGDTIEVREVAYVGVSSNENQ